MSLSPENDRSPDAMVNTMLTRHADLLTDVEATHVAIYSSNSATHQLVTQ